MKVADDIALWLAEHGVAVGFGIVGGGNFVLWDAITHLGVTNLICNHHEQAATMAASYYARSTGNIGFALVTTGAGSANALTGVIAAHMDGSPLFVISGNEASHYMHKPTRVWGVQGYDSSGLVSKVTKGSTRYLSATSIRETLDQMHELALKAPQGPVWIDIPKDIQGATV